MKTIEEKVDMLIYPQYKKRSRRIRRVSKRMAIGISILMIAATLIASGTLLSYYGKIETTATVSQSVLLDGNDYTNVVTNSITPTGGCCVCEEHTLQNQGCVDAYIHWTTTIPGNSDGIEVTLLNKADDTLIGNDFILKAGDTLNFKIRYCFAIDIAPGTFVITTKFQPGTPINSGTMVFQGTFGSNPLSGGAYILPMVNEETTDTGDKIAGFDVYAKNCAIAMYDKLGTGSDYAHGEVVGHDAYTTAGGWGSFYDPDCADWYNYQLRIDGDNWYLEYNNNVGNDGITTGATAPPMSGTIDKTNTYMYETGVGAYYSGMGTPESDGYAAQGGTTPDNPWTAGDGTQAWDMDWSWGSDYIPLEYAGFSYSVVDNGGTYTITLTPEASP